MADTNLNLSLDIAKNSHESSFPKPKTEKIFFYRKLGKSEFERCEVKDSRPLIILMRNPLDDIYELSLDEKIFTVTEFCDDYVIIDFEGRPQKIAGRVVEVINKWRRNHPSYMETSKKISRTWPSQKKLGAPKCFQYTKEQFDNISNELAYNMENAATKRLCKDSSGISKNILSYSFEFDWTNLSITFRKESLQDNFSETTPYRQIFFDECYSFGTGIKFHNYNYDREKFPEAVFSEIHPKVTEMRNIWAGKNLTVYPVNAQNNGSLFLESFTEVPYEPPLYDVLKHNFAAEIDSHIDRKNPECLKEFCTRNNIAMTKKMRTEYVNVPGALIKYIVLYKAGFKNPDIIFKLLQPENRIANYITEEESDFIGFCQMSLPLVGEIKLYNLLTKENKYFFSDVLRMLNLYEFSIPAEYKELLLKEGFTKYCHDILVSIVRKIKVSNIEFKYTLAQKKLCDKIDGYDFLLPKNREELSQLGYSFNNCVGSYWHAIANKKTTVVYAMKDGGYKMCIEIKSRDVVQAFRNSNKPLLPDEQVVLKKWIQKKYLGLKINL